MKVLVLGSGVIGVTTAYYLARAGHEVDGRRPPGRRRRWRPASPTPARSRPATPRPGPGPGVPLKAIKWLLMHHRPLVIWPMLDPAMWRWGLRDAAQLHRGALRRQQGRMVRLAEYSRDCLTRAARRRPASPTTSARRARCSCSARRSSSTAAASDIAVLERYGVPYEVLDRDGCIRARAGAGARAREVRRRPAPARRRDRRLLQVHAARWPSWPRQRGVDVPLRHDDHGASRATATASPASHTDAGALDGRRLRASRSAAIRRCCCAPLGIGIPVYPVKGYSITVPITDAAGAPESTVMDETHKVAVTRLGDRIRVGGTAELAGYDLTLHERAPRARWSTSSTDLFPRGGDVVARRVLVRPAADDAGRHAGRSAPTRDRATSTSPPATARSAGPWPPAPAA